MTVTVPMDSTMRTTETSDIIVELLNQVVSTSVTNYEMDHEKNDVNVEFKRDEDFIDDDEQDCFSQMAMFSNFVSYLQSPLAELKKKHERVRVYIFDIF